MNNIRPFFYPYYELPVLCQYTLSSLGHLRKHLILPQTSNFYCFALSLAFCFYIYKYFSPVCFCSVQLFCSSGSPIVGLTFCRNPSNYEFFEWASLTQFGAICILFLPNSTHCLLFTPRGLTELTQPVDIFVPP